MELREGLENYQIGTLNLSDKFKKENLIDLKINNNSGITWIEWEFTRNKNSGITVQFEW